jgi:hypothetical protein
MTKFYLEGQVPVFQFHRNTVARFYLQALGSFFIASYDSQGYGGGIRPRPHMGRQYRLLSMSGGFLVTTV